MSARRLAREVFVQTLYEMQVAEVDARVALRNNLERRGGDDDEVVRYAERLLAEYLPQRETVGEHVRAAIDNWDWERVGIVDRCVLEMATLELLCMPDVPRNVALDEAVRVARKFGSAESGAFVNGILDRVARRLLDEPPAPRRGAAPPD